ncbi:hypothetical protein K9857_03190 [Pseudomonas sp. REP124]|uniref:hypothetical protein n=1 Tax=Pseudomonas sp. REP124 TaxID=2875731 RepID=UPI001CCEF526|nr:hypothetical protein [Pseudomonas sp. REP124]MBZ9780553.1 hypothetical protein [Pseudomonas sp. REP124]
MNSITGTSFNHNATHTRELQLNIPTAQPVKAATEPATAPTSMPPRESVKVNLSLEGLKASASSSDTKASPAKDDAKMVEKIRKQMQELQEKIQEQQAQLQAVEANRNLSPEEKAQRVSAINQVLAGLNSSLASATAQLMLALKGTPEMKGGDAIQPMPFVRHEETAPPTNS